MKRGYGITKARHKDNESQGKLRIETMKENERKMKLKIDIKLKRKMKLKVSYSSITKGKSRKWKSCRGKLEGM